MSERQKKRYSGRRRSTVSPVNRALNAYRERTRRAYYVRLARMEERLDKVGGDVDLAVRKDAFRLSKVLAGTLPHVDPVINCSDEGTLYFEIQRGDRFDFFEVYGEGLFCHGSQEGTSSRVTEFKSRRILALKRKAEVLLSENQDTYARSM